MASSVPPMPALAASHQYRSAAKYDPLQQYSGRSARTRFELPDKGFDEVPAKHRRFYRRWDPAGDRLAPNEALCPVCKVVIRSRCELREGDRVFCMACMTRFDLVLSADGRLLLEPVY